MLNNSDKIAKKAKHSLPSRYMLSCSPGKLKVSKLEGFSCVRVRPAELTTGFHPQQCLEAPLQVLGDS